MQTVAGTGKTPPAPAVKTVPRAYSITTKNTDYFFNSAGILHEIVLKNHKMTGEDKPIIVRETDGFEPLSIAIPGLGVKSIRIDRKNGQELTVTITEREVSFEGHLYGVIAFYEFQYEGARWVLCGLGHQWNTTPGNIARMSLLLATHGHSSNTWVMEGYAHTEKPGENWLKYVPQNNTKTRTIRCIKKPVEYIYE